MVPNFFSFVGPRVPEGIYTIKMIKGKETYTSSIKLVPDPRSTHTAEDRAIQQRTVHELYAMLERLTYNVDAMVDMRDSARKRAEKLGEKDALGKRLRELADTVEKLRGSIVTTKESAGITGEEKLREKLGSLYGGVNGYDGRPTGSQLARVGVLGKQLDAAVAGFESLISKDLGPVNIQLEKRKLEALKPLTEAEWRKKQEKT